MAIPLQTLLLRAFLVKGKARSFPHIPSKQLQAGLNTIETSDSTGKINVPHYWAKFIHDGRGPVHGDPILIWFRNPKNDPRYIGGKYPVNVSQIRHLTRQQVQKWSRINQVIINRYRRATGKRKLKASDYRAMNLPMIVSTFSPKSQRNISPFFSNAAGGGMQGFRKEANRVGAAVVSKYVTDRLRSKGLLNMELSKTIRI